MIGVSISTLVVVAAFTPLDLSDDAVGRGEDRVFSIQGGYESALIPANSPAVVGHGLIRLRYVEDALVPGGGGVDVDLNTDTLTLSYFHNDLFGPWTYARAFVRAEAFAASLLVDHAENGRQRPTHAMGAGYVQGGALVAFSPLHSTTTFASVHAGLDVRQWFHFPFLGTADDLVLAPASQAVEPSASIFVREGQRRGALRRLDGAEGYASGRAFLAAGRRAYGFRAGETDARNANTDFFSGRMEGGVAAGVLTSQRLQTQFAFSGALRAGVGRGLDDRTRFLVGGENPYVVPFAGAGWAEFLVDQFFTTEFRAGTVLLDRIGLDVGTNVGMVNDVARQGALDELGFLSGVFVEAELRIVDDVLIRARLAKGIHLPRPGGDSGKVFVLVEWRALPWATWF